MNATDRTDRDVLVRYPLTDGASVEDGLLEALHVIDHDLANKRPPLAAFVNVDALERLNWDNADLAVRTRVWGYPVRITAERITVFRRV